MPLDQKGRAVPAQKKMGDGSRPVRRVWRYQDPQNGRAVNWNPGDPYTGPMDIEWLDHSEGFDGLGPFLEPLVADVPEPVLDAEKSAPAPSDSSVKEK